MNRPDFALLTGRAEQEMIEVSLPTSHSTSVLGHPQALKALLRLSEAMREEGFELALASGFRSYERQEMIWNRKARGELPLLDQRGSPLNYNELSPKEIVEAILRWSAIPGASRHHWGSEFDIFDYSQQTSAELTPQEVAPDGPMGPMHAWLDQHLEDFSFYRPYDQDRGGVAPERWHISFWPVSAPCFEAYTLETFLRVLEQSEFLLREQLITRAEEYFERYITNVAPR